MENGKKIRVELKERRGLVKGYCFTDKKGQTLEVVDMESNILDSIERIQTRFPDVIRASNNAHEEYGVSRSFRRGSHSKA